jgi:hypothetical protein
MAKSLKWSLPSGILNKILYVFLSTSMHATYTTHLTLTELINSN